MKLFSIASLMILHSVASFAADCTNFAGQYVMSVNTTDPTPMDLTIEQTDCNKLSAHYDSGDGKMIDRPILIDGQMHPTVVTSAYTLMEAFMWYNNDISYQQEVMAQGKVTHAFGSLSLDKDTLVEETVYYGLPSQPAHREHVVFKRK